MKEIGGYIELDIYHNKMLHNGSLALNCGRNCLAYLIKQKKIKKIRVPYFLCNSVKDTCEKYGAKVSFYHIDQEFIPEKVDLADDEWLYIVNYYGQISLRKMKSFKEKYNRVIYDNVQAYFQKPLDDSDTYYTCRKFFGVADGAFLYTNSKNIDVYKNLMQDESYDRMRFLLGRFERGASEFYKEYSNNNHSFINEPIKTMSKLTDNLLHGIDYDFVKNRRTENYNYLFDALSDMNRLKLKRIQGAFSYPLWIENGAEIRKKLLEYKIYIPTLWPNVLDDVSEDALEYDMAKNILPLPVDQRYEIDDMIFIVETLNKEC